MNTKIALLVHGYNGVPKIYGYFQKELKRNGYKVIIPEFPVREDITIGSYFEVFDKYKDQINPETILIGHSIGNAMIVKYLSANNLSAKAYIGLAGFGNPFIVNGRDDLNKVVEPLGLTDIETNAFKKLVEKRYAIYSDNDHIVPFGNLQEFPKMIGAEEFLVPGIGHMGKKSGLEKLPIVIELIVNNC